MPFLNCTGPITNNETSTIRGEWPAPDRVVTNPIRRVMLSIASFEPEAPDIVVAKRIDTRKGEALLKAVTAHLQGKIDREVTIECKNARIDLSVAADSPIDLQGQVQEKLADFKFSDYEIKQTGAGIVRMDRSKIRP